MMSAERFCLMAFLLLGWLLGMCVFQKRKKKKKESEKEKRESKKKIKMYLNWMKILSFILPNPKCKRSAKTLLWKGKCCGVDTEETTSKFQQFYIRLQLQQGELGDTTLRGRPSPLMARKAWALSWCSLSQGMEAVPGPSHTGPCFPLGVSLCHHHGSLAWSEITSPFPTLC